MNVRTKSSNKGLILVLIMVSLLIGSCTHAPIQYFDNTPVVSNSCSADTVYFQNEILPLLNSTCATTGCHNAVSAKHDVVLTDYNSVMHTGGINLALPSESKIYKVLLKSNDERMPPSPAQAWTSSQANRLLTWISQGAINNACLEATCDTTNVTFKSSVDPIFQTYCYGCHSATNASGNVDLTNFNQLFTLINNGALLASIRHDAGYSPMPKGSSKLSDCEIGTIAIWARDTTLTGNGSGSCDTTNVTFKSSVDPIFQTYCYGCHSATNASGNVDLTNFDQLAILINNGALLGSIRHDAGYSPMPKGSSKLSDCEIGTITIWVRDTTLTGSGGGGSTGNTCDPDTVYFQNTVLPLLTSGCAVSGCHDATTRKHGVQLTDYSSIMQTGGVSAGNPNGSKLYTILSSGGGGDKDDGIMPPYPRAPFTTDQKNIVKNWILQGAKNNYCDSGCDTTNVTFSGSVFPIVETYCLSCHNGNSPGGGIYLRNYNDLVAVANNGKLMGSIRHDQGYSPMPKNGNKLSDCQISTFNIWIKNGTPNN